MAKWNPKNTPPLIPPATIQDDLLRQETLAGSGQPGPTYKTLGPDPMLQTQYENFIRTYQSSFYRQSQVNLLPSVTRDIEVKASRAKTQKELDKVIKDTIAIQTKYLDDLLTDINNRANTIGTTAQIRLEKQEELKQTGGKFDQDLIDFYESKINEVKSIESSLRTYAESVTKKLTGRITKQATRSFQIASKEREETRQKKINVEEARIVSKYQSQFEKSVKQELDLIAKRTAYEQAQEYISSETKRGVDPKQAIAEAKKLYDATREEVLTKTKVETKLPREEILARYESQSKQFSKYDFVSEITQMPAFVNEARKFELEFRTGLVKTGQEILDYFTKVGQVVPQELEKQLKKPSFTAESGTVFASGITDKNREAITSKLQETFQKASGPAPYTPPTLEPKPTYIDVLRERIPAATGLQRIAELLTTTAKERKQQPPSQPTPPGKPPVPPNFNKSSLSPPPGDDGGGMGLNGLTDLATRMTLLRSRLKIVGDIVSTVTAIPKEMLKATESATTREGIEPAQATQAFATGFKKTTAAGGSAVGSLIGGVAGGAILGPIGAAAGMVAGSSIGGMAGNTAGGMLADPIPILTKIADNTAKSVQVFSPQVLTARLDNQIEMLKLNIDTADRYGQELADLQIYSNTLRQEMYKLGVEFLIAFKPFIEDMTSLVIFIVTTLRYFMKLIYGIFEFTVAMLPVINIFRALALTIDDWIGSNKKKESNFTTEDFGTGALMENRPKNM